MSLKRLRRTPPRLDAPFGLLPISVLKPLKGADAGLEENLESFFRLDYPEYELIFSVADRDDPAVPVVRALLKRHPRARARLVIGAVNVGPNPKVNNLITSFAEARHDWTLISDSNVRVERDYLRRLAGHLHTDVGLVTSVIAGREPRGLGGHLEATYLNSFYARGMNLADALGHPCVVGKSMLIRRSTAERFGGIRALGRYLAEDYMAGVAVMNLGLRVVTACDPVPQHIGRYTFRQFWSRHVRWGRIRKAHAPLAFVVEPLSGPIVSGLLGAIGAAAAFGADPGAFLGAHLALWSACDFLVMRLLNPGLNHNSVVAWFLREALALPLWIATAAGNTVEWRGRRLALMPGGLLETCNDEKPDAAVPVLVGNRHQQPSD